MPTVVLQILVPMRIPTAVLGHPVIEGLLYEDLQQTISALWEKRIQHLLDQLPLLECQNLNYHI
jgi:hypothetical protein